MLLAAIGEQFSDSLADDDEICGLTVSVREKFDVVQLWNVNAALASKASVINKVIRLLPEVDFAEPLYKRKYFNFLSLSLDHLCVLKIIN